MNTSDMDSPLVTVGIPTYNRPEGLERTLKCICNQTYRNLEILVSDNCSVGDEVRNIVERYASGDSRIIFHRQDENRGVEHNFKFVLQNATGEYFMWAADDDEWDPRFIEVCIANSNGVSGAMTSIGSVNRTSNTEEMVDLPDISPDFSLYRNLRNHLLKLRPGLFYALYRKDDILWFLNSEVFDYCDCYFVSRILVRGNGIRLTGDLVGYKSGIDTENYELKPIAPAKGQNFLYRPFFQKHLSLVWSGGKLTFFEKIALSELVSFVTLQNYSHHERRNKLLAKLARPFVKFRRAFFDSAAL
jgi:glycosyltransferase involved in cell wall biosynthesis